MADVIGCSGQDGSPQLSGSRSECTDMNVWSVADQVEVWVCKDLMLPGLNSDTEPVSVQILLIIGRLLLILYII